MVSLSSSFRRGRLLVLAATVGIWALASLLLLWSGRTVSGAYTADAVAVWDGANRVLAGQSPNLSFHWPIGPLGTIIPAIGLWLGGLLGAMMPWATVMVSAALLPVLLYVADRLPSYVALGFVAYTLVLVMAPLVPGDPVERMSFAMFYNRWGWAILGLIGVLLLPSSRPRLDAALVAVLIFVLAYLKVTFAVAGAGMAGLALVLLRRKDLLVAGAALVTALFLVELLWHGTAEYIADLKLAAAASGAMRGTLWTLGRAVIENLPALLVFGLVWLSAFLRQARREYLVLSAVLAIGGVPLLNQSAQASGILTLVPACLIALYAPARKGAGAEQALLAILAVPIIVTHGLALAYHTVLSSRPQAAALDGLSGAPNGIDDAYLATIPDGISLLRRHGIRGGVVNLDIANPFNAALGGPSPTGVELAYVLERTFTPQSHRENLLGNAPYVMLPKRAWHKATPPALLPLVQTSLMPIAESKDWVLFQNRPPMPKRLASPRPARQ